MHKIDGAGHVDNEFVGEDEATNRPPTVVTPKWLNTVQRELVAAVVAGGLAFDGEDDEQVITALKRIFAGNVRTIAVAGPTALTADDAGLVLVDAAANNVAITLPAVNSVTNAPLLFQFVRVDGSTNTATVSRAGTDTLVGGASSFTLLNQGDHRCLVGDAIAAWATTAMSPGANGFKLPVRFTTTGNIALSGLGTQAGGDWGIALTAGDRILPKDQATGADRGIYIASAGAWTRATDADGAGELIPGALVVVSEGVTLSDTLWELSTDGPITIGTTALTFSRKDPVAALSGFRNKIINGAIMVDQRNLGVAQTFTAAAALAYCVDRWYGYCTGANITGQQVAGPIANTYRYQFGGAVSNTGFGFGTRLEAVNTARMAGSTATLSAKIKSSALASITWSAYYATTKDTFGTLASPTRTLIATGSFAISATEATYNAQLVIPGGATTGIEVVFSGGALVSGQTLTIGDIQLEQAAAASAFEELPFNLELATCQRYFEKLASSIQSSYANGGTGNARWTFKVPKRVTPTMSWGGGSSAAGVVDIDRASTSATGYAYINTPTSASAEL